MQGIHKSGKRAGYIEARRIAAKHGGLPPNLLFDRYLFILDGKKGLEDHSPAWAKELLAHPEKGGRFQRGVDVESSVRDSRGRKWILPADYMRRANEQKDAFRPDAALFIVPESVIEDPVRVVVHPESIVVVHKLVQDAEWGMIGEETGLPQECSFSSRLLSPVKRQLARIDGINVSPLVREASRSQVVFTGYKPDADLWVTSVVDTFACIPVNVPPHELAALVEAADASLQVLSETASSEKLAAVRELVQALKQ